MEPLQNIRRTLPVEYRRRMTMVYRRFQSPYCPIVIAGDSDGIKYLHLESGENKGGTNIIEDGWRRDDGCFEDAVKQLGEYFAGKRESFDLKLAPAGTEFQMTVWAELRRIPFGETISYGEIAKRIGRPSASRAVGAANGRNPIAVIIPCHRVIGAGGKLTGYAHGLELKEKLLSLEKK